MSFSGSVVAFVLFKFVASIVGTCIIVFVDRVNLCVIKMK
jgi:hypothetical protein